MFIFELKNYGIIINEDIKKMADLLRRGNTMLNLACPICNNPIFRKRNGEKFCPICNRKVKIVDNELEQDIIQTEIVPPLRKIKEINKNEQKTIELNSLKEVITNKIEWIIQKLNSETQIDLIERHVKILLDLYDILKKVNYS